VKTTNLLFIETEAFSLTDDMGKFLVCDFQVCDRCL